MSEEVQRNMALNVLGKGEHRVLLTENHQLRFLSEDDVNQQYLSWMSDPEVVEFLDSRYTEQTLDNIRQYVCGFDQVKRNIWAIYTKADDVWIGNATLVIDSINNIAEPGILIGDKNSWGHNVLLEVYARLFDFCFDDLGIIKVMSKTRAVNVGAMWNHRKLGMSVEAVLPNHMIYGDTRTSLVLLSIFEEQWRKKRESIWTFLENEDVSSQS